MNKNHDPKTGQFTSSSLHLVGGQMHTGAEVNALSMRHGGLHMIPGGYGGPHVMGGGAQPRQTARAVPPPRNVPPPAPPKAGSQGTPGNRPPGWVHPAKTPEANARAHAKRKTGPHTKEFDYAAAPVKPGKQAAMDAHYEKANKDFAARNAAVNEGFRAQAARNAAAVAKPPPAAAKHGARPIQPNEHGPGPAFGPHAPPHPSSAQAEFERFSALTPAQQRKETEARMAAMPPEKVAANARKKEREHAAKPRQAAWNSSNRPTK